MPYFPEHSFVMGIATIRRERALPPGAFGEIMARAGSHVEGPDVVVRGAIAGSYIILDALEGLGLRRASELTPDMFFVQPGEAVIPGQVLAQHRRRKMIAPEISVVSRIDEEKIILQLNPEPIEIRALCPGEITSIRGTTGVLIQSQGALVQCGWGNGKQAFTGYQVEPDAGIDSLPSDGLLPQYRGIAMLTKEPILSEEIFRIAKGQEMSGLIAPSMHADLREIALAQTIPVILTEGFGEGKMSEMVYNLLLTNKGRQATLDASQPERFTSVRPEIIIPLPSGRAVPPVPELDKPITEGAQIRITRDPLAGMSGFVRRLIDTPQTLESGLRLPGAEIQLTNGRTVFVPFANLELLGQPLEAEIG